MKSIKQAIPSFVTSLALLAGCISIVFSSMYNDLTVASYFILAAAVFDFFDGFLARLLKATSEFGKQYDSLSDVISFGVAPSMIMLSLIRMGLVTMSSTINIFEPGFSEYVFLFCPFLIAIFAAIRLAKFNIDDEQKKSFKGLPTPANALFIISVGVASEHNEYLPAYDLTHNLWFLLALVFVLSLLMVSNIKLFALKFENYSFKGNSIRYLFLLISVVILGFFGIPGFAIVIILYLILSVIVNLVGIKG